MSRRAKVRVVTGLVPIPLHPRSGKEYADLGDRLKSALGDRPIAVYYQPVDECWLHAFLEKLPFEPTWSKGDNPGKNSWQYHVVNHEKFQWLERAANDDQESDSFVWLDYGIMRLPGVDGGTINDFLDKIKKNDFAIPGCWPPGQFADDLPCWRFCGSVFIVPRADIRPLNKVLQAVTRLSIRSTQNVTWEVNSLAHAEATGKLQNLRWYPADHNARMFTGYDP